MAILVIVLAVVNWKRPASGQAYGFAAVFSAIRYVIYVTAVNSAVRMDQNGVVVENVIMRHVIPWAKLSEIGVNNGLCFRLDNGTIIKSVSYAGSVGAVLTNYRYIRGVAARMEAARERLTAGRRITAVSAGYGRQVRASPWPPVLILGFLEAITLLSQVLR